MSKGSKDHTNSRYIPGLDGLRALAVGAVLLYHLFPTVFIGGYIGVDIFFVISGFLITTLLIGERMAGGRIALRKFWLRRARRLLPALFTTIVVVSSIIFFIRGDAMVGLGRQILGAATFSSNWVEVISGTDYFAAGASHLFMNFWSLGVEEQFYLLWPFAVILIVSVVRKPRLGMLLTGLFAAASAGWMAYAYAHGASASRVYYGTDTHLFGLMIGAFLAFWSAQKGDVLRRLYQPFWFIRQRPLLSETIGVFALGGLVVSFVLLSDQYAVTYLGGLFATSILSACLLVAAVGKGGVIQKICEHPLSRYIGSRSYGIYLWHWPLIIIAHLLLPPYVPAWLLAVPVTLTTFGFAELSYRFIELPVRRNGFKAIFKKAVKKRLIQIDASTVRVRRRPHVALLPLCLAVALTIAAVLTAPTKTSAQLRIEAGERSLTKSPVPTSPPPAPAPSIPLDGPHMSAVGDSVTVASSPALQATFPGILINAEVSRSMRRGGLETIEQMNADGQLRHTVIVALGTNGYFGTGYLERMISELPGHNIVLVTAHAEREWTAPNNAEIAAAAQKYKNVSMADWDHAIASRPDLLGEDGIHPKSAEGDTIYAQCIAAALQKFK